MAFFSNIRSARYGASLPVSNEGLFINILGGGKTHAGPVVTHASAMNIPAVYAAVRIISEGLAMLPIDVRQKRKSGSGSDEVESHDISYLLNNAPNDYMTAFTFRSTKTSHQVLWGNGYAEIERTGGGKAAGLWPMLPDRTGPKKNQEGNLFFETNVSGTTYPIAPENTLHNPALGFDGYVGYSPISLARQGLGLTLAAETFGAKFFGNDAKSGGFLMHPARLGEKATQNLATSMNSNGEGLEKAHRIRILEEGMKFVSTTIPPDDAQFLQTRTFQIEEIARMFGVPLILLQSMEKATTWGSGIESMVLGFLIWTLQPWIVREEQEFNRKLFTAKEREQGLYVKMNTNALMRGDMAGRSAFYQSGINNGWLTRNEVREKEDMNPIPGLEKPLQPLNMTSNTDGTGNALNITAREEV